MTLWYQVFPEEDLSAARTKMDRAVKAGCKAICITVRAPLSKATARPALNWTLIDQLRKGIGVPVVVKGIMTTEDATAAVKRDIQGIVVSNYGRASTPGMVSSMELLP
jgi:isopentenyl diphosphate isomerase/L-lactate dehydrogenase-like FMN-dependent dehydrogenase